MKAVIIERYGPPEVLKIKEIPKPTISDKEILVEIKAFAVTAADYRIRAARFPKGLSWFARLAFGITKPRVKILGNTFSGVVLAVGKEVDEFKVGDEVCGMTGVKMGTYAEYLKLSNLKGVAKKPKNVNHLDAAGLVFGGTAALYFLREKLHTQRGDTVLINGASGAVGTNAVQLANYFGGKVTGVTSADNAKLVKSIGAAEIIDYTKENIDTIDKKFDVVLDAIGNISPDQARRLLSHKGRAGLMVASLGQMLQARGPVKTGTATEKRQDIEFLLSLLESGKLTVVVEKIYDFKDIVAAHMHADTGKKVGNIIVKVS